MTAEEFDARWARDVRHAEETLLRDGQLHPLFALVGEGGEGVVIPAPFRDHAEKGAYVTLARLAAIAADAVFCVFRTESWMADAAALPEGVPPSESDGRIEVVMVSASARIGGRLVRRVSAREIVRGDTGGPVGLREPSLTGFRGDGEPEGEWSGLFLDILPPERPSAEARELAGALFAEQARRMGMGLSEAPPRGAH